MLKATATLPPIGFSTIITTKELCCGLRSVRNTKSHHRTLRQRGKNECTLICVTSKVEQTSVYSIRVRSPLTECFCLCRKCVNRFIRETYSVKQTGMYSLPYSLFSMETRATSSIQRETDKLSSILLLLSRLLNNDRLCKAYTTCSNCEKQ